MTGARSLLGLVKRVASNDRKPVPLLEEALVLLTETEEERTETDWELGVVLAKLGFTD